MSAGGIKYLQGSTVGKAVNNKTGVLVNRCVFVCASVCQCMCVCVCVCVCVCISNK